MCLLFEVHFPNPVKSPSELKFQHLLIKVEVSIFELIMLGLKKG